MNPRKFTAVGPCQAWLASAIVTVANLPIALSYIVRTVLFVLVLGSQPLLGQPLPELRSNNAIKALPATEAARGYPVTVQGTITYVHPDTYALFLQDSSAGIYVTTGDPGSLRALDLKAGSLVEVNGFTFSGGYAPIIQGLEPNTRPKIRVLGMTNLPAPIRISADLSLMGTAENAWVEATGVVRDIRRVSANEEEDRLRLQLDTGAGFFRVLVAGFPKARPVPLHWIDSAVRIRGVFGSLFNDQRQLLGVQILTPSSDQVFLDAPAPPDPFSSQEVPFQSLMQFKPERLPTHRVLIRGVVTTARPNRGFYLSGDQGFAWVESEQSPLPKRGDIVQTSGFPAPGHYHPKLESAIYRKIGQTNVPQPTLLALTNVLDATLENQFVSIEAEVSSHFVHPEGVALGLRVDSQMIECVKLGAASFQNWAALPVGSWVRISGVYEPILGTDSAVRGARLWCADPQSLVVLKTPSWWTPRRLLFLTAVLGGAILLGMGFMIWLSAKNQSLEEQIRERHRAEEALRSAHEALQLANDNLEAKVNTRTSELRLEIEERRKAELAAARANQSKSEFLANMSHEIRTPMNGIIGMTHLLLGTPLTEEQRDFASTVRTSADALLTVLNDILDLSKIEAGQLEIEKVDFEVREAIESCLDLFAERAQAKGIELAYLVHREVPRRVRGDPGRLRQVLLNLVGNAIKFTQQGEVFVEVGLREQSDAHSLLHFTITDTGIGITPEAKSRLFQPFVQAESSTARRFGGTGLGLAICRRLVEMMEGSIGVESEPRKGSTFWFTLRLPPPESSPNTPDPRLRPGTSLEGVRTLIVDDNATNRKILEYQITGWRMAKVGSVGNGFEAIEALEAALARQEPIKIAILDFQMPGMDGLELARRIQSRPEFRGVRVIILTSMCERIQPEALRAASVEAWLVKPVKPSHLYDAIANALSKDALNYATRPGHPETPSALPAKSDQFAKDYPGKLLVVEDSTINQKLAVKLLEKLGYVPDLASDGVQAIEALRRADYDLIFMDCQMPEMDGYEATRRIRKQSDRTRQPRIVAMTANAMKGDRELCLAAGMDDYVSKPISVEEVKRALREGLATPASQVSAAL